MTQSADQSGVRSIPQSRLRRGFTLVELLVSMAILTLIVVLLATIVNQTSATWQYTNSRIEQFRGARDGFEAMTRRLSQATLNTYWDYLDANGAGRTSANSASFVPARYARQSELRFISGPGLAGDVNTTPPRPTHSIFFQAPLGYVEDRGNFGGLENLLNTWGYYIEFNMEPSRPPFVTGTMAPPRYRYRLMELMCPSEKMPLYKYTSGSPTYSGQQWFTDLIGPAISGTYTHVLAENIVALVILPKLSQQDENKLIPKPTAANLGTSLAPKFSYDSTQTNANPSLNPKNQLPPVLQVTMVAVDEASYSRVQSGTKALDLGLAPLFTTQSGSPATQADLDTLQATLLKKHINFRVFTTEISLKAAKWSRSQAN
ncbi:MAG: Verru_Chthon cassette protein C [Verrucomicrobiota bacterium]